MQLEYLLVTMFFADIFKA